MSSAIQNMMHAWRADWTIFVDRVSADCDHGLSNETVSAAYADQKVTWVGQVAALRLDDMPGVQMTMPAISVELSDGRYTVADFLFLHLEKGDVDSWKDVSVGDLVRFKATLCKCNGPFPGIQWANLNAARGILLLATHDCRFVEVIGATLVWPSLPMHCVCRSDRDFQPTAGN